MNSELANSELLEKVRMALEDTKAVELQVLDVRQMTAVTDYMVVVTGTSGRHVRALANNLLDTLSKSGIKPFSIEGEQEAEWVLVDLQDVIVHVMQKTARDFYQLERLWITEDAVPLTRHDEERQRDSV